MKMTLRERVRDWIATHPGGPLGAAVSLRHGLPRHGDRRDVAIAGSGRFRVLIAPANYAGQARLWARALSYRADVSVRTLAVESPFGFTADALVSPRVFQHSRRWQTEQLAATRDFTHVLVESLIPPFGRLRGRDLERQLRLLPQARVALICHGTDVRSISPRHHGPALTAAERQADRIARRHRELIQRLRLPTFVSTPDLLDDVPNAHWVPVVVDVHRWRSEARPDGNNRPPRVVHVPSSSALKGTSLIEPVVNALHAEGVIEYRPGLGVPHTEMPRVLAEADILLDQFVVGSYGVAACEAMASGAVVVGHVTTRVRERVRAATGHELPIIEATPDTLDSVLRGLCADPVRRAQLSALGPAFVAAVHGGAMSASVLAQRWLDITPPVEDSHP